MESKHNTAMSLPARQTAALGLALLLAGCGGGGNGNADPTACRPDGQPLARETQAITVARAVARNPSGQIRVKGGYFRRGDARPQLCSRLRQTTPRQCVRPSLTIQGLGNAKRLFDQIETTGKGGLPPTTPPVSFAEEIFVPGRLERSTLIVEPGCDTKRVIDVFEEETDQVLQLDLLSSDDNSEHVNFDAVESGAVAQTRKREWGTFDIVVSTGGVQLGLDQALVQIAPFAEVPTNEPDENGVVWARIQGGPWLALSEYDDNVVLTWLAGAQRATNDRWKRLDEILSALS